jgi:hypothetical protein
MPGLESSNASHWEELIALVDRFAAAWKHVGSADLAQFLPASSNPLRLRALHRLIETEMEFRYQRREQVLLEHYLERFSELGASRELPAALICAEFRLRQRYGAQPVLAAYRQRFPNQYEEVQELLRRDPNPTLSPAAAANLTPGPALAESVPSTLHPAHGPAPKPPTGVVSPPSQVVPSPEGFKLLARLGGGQFGEVWRAAAPGDVEVAVKRIFRTLDDEASRKEFEALKRICNLGHPFLLRTQAFFIQEEKLIIVMELAEDSLRDWFKKEREAGRPGIPAPELVAYLREAAEGLDYLHSHHILHRDIKPENLLRLKGHAKVADFGLGRLMEDRIGQATLCGTPLYMAPEVWQGQISVHSDQYSLAVTYAELRTGKRIFSASDQFQIGWQHLRETPHLESLPQAERNVLLKALAKEPDERYSSCLDFAKALDRAVNPVEPAPQRAPGRAPRRWVAAALVTALLGIVAAGVAAAIWIPRPRPVLPPSRRRERGSRRGGHPGSAQPRTPSSTRSTTCTIESCGRSLRAPRQLNSF